MVRWLHTNANLLIKGSALKRTIRRFTLCFKQYFVLLRSTCTPEGHYCQDIDCRGGSLHLFQRKRIKWMLCRYSKPNQLTFNEKECTEIIYTLSLDLWQGCLESVDWPSPVCCFQLMVAGPRGLCGLTAQSPVVGAHRFEPTPASTLLHVTTGLTAAGRREKHRTVTLLPVSVCSQALQLYSFIHNYLSCLSITKTYCRSHFQYVI